MSCNIRCFGAYDGENNWPHRKDVCIEVIRSRAADIICCQEVGREMIRQKHGNIINISSSVGVSAVDPKSGQFISYQASKAAINIMTKQLAVEWGPHNIRVNVIAPSFLSTRLTDALIARTGENMKRWIPLGRVGRPDEIRGAVVFLASEASSKLHKSAVLAILLIAIQLLPPSVVLKMPEIVPA
jgi:NAD(P)-dependent dehydrogenase (short-subunit alcohol dehydrogenase family)